MKREIPLIPDIERFTSKYEVDERTGCWNWIACLNDMGYGQFSVNKKSMRAHRVSWRIFKGPLNPDLVIDHKCRNRKCVNPEHLREVTTSMNITENSNSYSALNKAKTHCPQGHEYNEENTKISPQSCGRGLLGRHCKQCIRDGSNKKYAANKETINARRKERYHENAKANREKIYEARRRRQLQELF